MSWPPEPYSAAEDERPWAIAQFLLRLRSDEAAGEVKPLRIYLAEFPEHEELVAREYLQVRALDRRAEEIESCPQTFGQFRLEHEIGTGGEGTVFLAHEAMLDRWVALKILRMPLGELEEARFLRAASLAARLDHPNLCRVHDAGRCGQAMWVAMQYVNGRTLAQELTARRQRREPMLEQEGAKLIAPILDGLQHAHEHRVVHRDVKPGNILLRPDGTPMLVDFGLARDLSRRQELTAAGELRGTIAYMAPEQIDGRASAPAVDVWACGVMLFECVSLSLPFTGASAAAISKCVIEQQIWEHPAWTTLSRDLRAVLATALHKDPERRYDSAEAFAQDLDRVAAGEPVSVRSPGPALRLRAWGRREPALAAGLVVAAMALIVGLMAVGWWWQRERELRTAAETSAARAHKVAYAILFDINDAMMMAQGSVAVRQRLVTHAKDALAALCADAPRNMQLRRELALAWMRLGDLHGHDSVANLADAESAHKCFAAAERIARESLAEDLRASRLLAATLIKRAALLIDSPERAVSLCHEAIAHAQGPSDDASRLRAVARSRLAMIERNHGRYDSALALVHAASVDFGPGGSAQDIAALRDLEATILASRGDVAGAIAMLRDQLHELSDSPAATIRLRGSLLLHLAQCLSMVGSNDDAMARFTDLETMWRHHISTNPTDMGSVLRLVKVLEERGSLLSRLGRTDDAESAWREAHALAKTTGHKETIARIRLRLPTGTFTGGVPPIRFDVQGRETRNFLIEPRVDDALPLEPVGEEADWIPSPREPSRGRK